MPDDRVEFPQDAFLRKTRQLWKLTVATLILPWPVVVIGWWTFHHLGPDQSDSSLVIAIGAMAAIAALIVALLASVQCPACEARLMKRAVQDPDGLNALTRLLKVRTCPVCGRNPQAGPMSTTEKVAAR